MNTLWKIIEVKKNPDDVEIVPGTGNYLVTIKHPVTNVSTVTCITFEVLDVLVEYLGLKTREELEGKTFSVISDISNPGRALNYYAILLKENARN